MLPGRCPYSGKYKYYHHSGFCTSPHNSPFFISSIFFKLCVFYANRAWRHSTWLPQHFKTCLGKRNFHPSKFPKTQSSETFLNTSHRNKFDPDQKRPLFLGNICCQTWSIWSSCAERACQNIRRRSGSRRQTKRHKQEWLPGTARRDILPRGEGASLTLIRHTSAENNIKLNQVFLETWLRSPVLRLKYVKTGNELD